MSKTFKKITKRTSTVIAKPAFEAEIKIRGKKYNSIGVTIVDAIKNLKVIGFSKVMSVLSIRHSKQEKSRVLRPLQTFRLFNPSPLTREIAIKQISLLF